MCGLIVARPIRSFLPLVPALRTRVPYQQVFYELVMADFMFGCGTLRVKPIPRRSQLLVNPAQCPLKKAFLVGVLSGRIRREITTA